MLTPHAVKVEAFSYVTFFLFQYICIDAGHMSEKTLYNELNITRDECD